jgi:LysM repeat protein
VSRDRVLRLAAPGAFLAALTIAVLLIRSGLNHSGTKTTSTGATATVSRPAQTVSTATATSTQTASGVVSARQYYTVQSGDTYGSIATKSGTTVQQLQQLNPGTSSNSLSVGQKIRVK